MKQRLGYIDEMKGFAILLVVLGHLFLPYTQDGQLYPISSMIYSFHMSFFFFLSGYVNEKVNKIDIIGREIFIGKKFRTLIIPFLFWSFVSPFFLDNNIPHTWNEFIEPFCIFPNKHYWFLPVLFVFMIFYLFKHAIEKYGTKYNILFSFLTILAFFVAGAVFEQYHIMIYGIYYASFLFGDYLSKYEKIRGLVMKNSVYGCGAVILCIMWKFYPIYPTDTIWQSLANIVMSFVCSFVACIVFYNFFRKTNIHRYIQCFLSEMGKFSLVIYVVPIELLPHSFIFPEWMPNALVNLEILFIGIVITLLRYIIGKIIFEIPVMRYVMFGKK